MQNSRKIKSVEWMDNKQYNCCQLTCPLQQLRVELWPYLKCNGAVYGQHTPIHLQYTTTFMRDIDFTDQLKGRYCWQLPRHKGWHMRMFISCWTLQP